MMDPNHTCSKYLVCSSRNGIPWHCDCVHIMALAWALPCLPVFPIFEGLFARSRNTYTNCKCILIHVYMYVDVAEHRKVGIGSCIGF